MSERRQRLGENRTGLHLITSHRRPMISVDDGSYDDTVTAHHGHAPLSRSRLTRTMKIPIMSCLASYPPIVNSDIFFVG